MSSSEDYLRELHSAAGSDWGAAVREVFDAMGNRASSWLAAAGGKDMRSGERWISKATDRINPKTGRPSQASTPKPEAQVAIVAAVRNWRVAQKLRAAQTVHAGRVEVAYADTGRSEGPRNVGNLPVAGTLQTAVGAAADAVEQGDYAVASELLDAGVMDAYGVPEGTLEVSDYVDGFSVD